MRAAPFALPAGRSSATFSKGPHLCRARAWSDAISATPGRIRVIMTNRVEAVYENGVLRPLEPLPLTEHQLVTVIVSDLPSRTRFSEGRRCLGCRAIAHPFPG